MLMQIELTLPRDAWRVRAMRELAACGLSSFDAPSDVIEDVQLALGEACANAVKHAMGTSSYRVRMHIDPHGCRIEIYDQGPGIKPAAIEPGSDLEAEKGRGFDLMHHLMDNVSVFQADQQNTVSMTKGWA